MGAWGVQFNENDGALDFLGDVEDSRDWVVVGERLTDYVDDGGYDDADEALAACELVAAAIGRPSPLLDADLARWAAEHAKQAAATLPVARQAAQLVRTSELNELWSEADEYAAWQASVEELIGRLG